MEPGSSLLSSQKPKIISHIHNKLNIVPNIKIYFAKFRFIIIVTDMIIAKQRFGKHVPAATNSRGIINCSTTVPVAMFKYRKIE
jgi:hypothetical protein